MKNQVLVYSMLFLLAFLAVACCPVNPPPYTAKSAHGNTDWHIDTANEFLFGTDMGGTTTATNHCPNTWTRTHMHVGLTNTRDFYYDSDLDAAGNDTDGTSGIDTAMLFFYAGHGSPTAWNTLGNNATQSNMNLGDCPGDGLTRYYFQCSCEVFAHGPRICTGAPWDYSCPGLFDGSPDSHNMRNVYERWGPVLTKDVRMVCGMSTPAYCHEAETNGFWYRYNTGYDVADAFVAGFRTRSTSVIPVCMTIGGADVTDTPLYDTDFTHQANDSGTSYYHIQYVSSFASTPTVSATASSIHLPEMLPILEVKPMPLPESLREVEFADKDGLKVYPSEVERDEETQTRIDPASGAVYILGERQEKFSARALDDEEYVKSALDFIKAQDWDEEELSEPIGERLMIESVPANGKQGDLQRLQKSIVLTFRRYVKVDDQEVKFLGEGGTIRIQMNNDGSVLNAAKVWRKIEKTSEPVKLKTYDEAYKEAMEEIREPEVYKLHNWTWGYKEAAGNIKQNDLMIVIIFEFMPVDLEKMIDYPPLRIEIPGQVQ